MLENQRLPSADCAMTSIHCPSASPTTDALDFSRSSRQIVPSCPPPHSVPVESSKSTVVVVPNESSRGTRRNRSLPVSITKSCPPTPPAQAFPSRRTATERSEEHTSELQSREKLVCR